MISLLSSLKTLIGRFNRSRNLDKGLLTRVVKSSLIVDNKVQAGAYHKRPNVDMSLSMDSLSFYGSDPNVGFDKLLHEVYPAKRKCTRGKFVFFEIQEARQMIDELALSHGDFRCSFTEPGKSSHVDVHLHEADISMMLADISGHRDAHKPSQCLHCQR